MAGLPRRFTCPQAVTHTSSNRARCQLTVLMKPTLASNMSEWIVGYTTRCDQKVVLCAVLLRGTRILQSLLYWVKLVTGEVADFQPEVLCLTTRRRASGHMLPVTVFRVNSPTTWTVRRRSTYSVPGDSHQQTELRISSLVGICLCRRPSSHRSVSTQIDKTGLQIQQFGNFYQHLWWRRQSTLWSDPQ